MKQQSASNWLIWVLMMFIPMSTMGKGWKAKHVVMIGIDGWASHDFDKAPDVPNIRWMKTVIEILGLSDDSSSFLFQIELVCNTVLNTHHRKIVC